MEELIYAQKRKSPLVLIIILLIVAAVLGAVAFLFFSGSRNLTYRQAERASLISSGNLITESKSEFNTADFDFTFTPSKSLLPDTNPTSFKGTVTADAQKIYTELSYLNGDKTVLSLLAWVDENLFTFGIPNVSDIFLKIAASDISGDRKSNTELDMINAYKTLDTILESYFDLTENDNVTKNVEVSLDGITRKCDLYSIVIDDDVLNKFLISSIEALLENPNLIQYIEEYISNFQLTGDEFDLTSELNEALNECKTNNPFSGSGLKITMDAYISGNDIVKRQISIRANNETVDLIITNLEDKNRYADKVTVNFESESFDTVDYENFGNENNGANTGIITVKIFNSRNSLEQYTLKCSYENFEVDQRGLLSGDIKIEIPEMGLILTTNAVYEENVQTITGEAVISDMKLIKFDYVISYSNKEIQLPDRNAYDVESEEANAFGESLIEYFNNFNENFIGNNGNYDTIGSSISELFSVFNDFSVMGSAIIGSADGYDYDDFFGGYYDEFSDVDYT